MRGRRSEAARRGRRPWLALLLGTFITGTAGAYVPGASPSVPAAGTSVVRTPAVRDYERLLTHYDAEERRLNAELASVGPEIKLVRARMIARGRAYYRLVKAGLLPVGGGFDALVDHATRVEQLRGALGQDIDAIKRLRGRKRDIEKRLRLILAERAPLAVHREAMQRAKSAMRQADERRAAFERAFGTTDASPHVAIYGATGGVEDAESMGRFSDLRGRLPFPLSGRAELMPALDLGASVSGLRLRAGRDAAVRSVYAGRVVFVGQAEHGLTVVVEHGGRFFSLYGQLQRTEVKEGDELAERGDIGWVLRRGSEPPTLYFELRRGTAVLDAATWLGL